ncbi:MAG: hypothetical protein AAFQ14_17100 [Cyanobacteria bacterium J06621_12]
MKSYETGVQTGKVVLSSQNFWHLTRRAENSAISTEEAILNSAFVGFCQTG